LASPASLRPSWNGSAATRTPGCAISAPPHHQDSALYPFIAQLERAALFAREDPPDSKLGKLAALLAPASPSAEQMALFAELLSLPAAPRYPPPALSAQRKKERTFEALLRQLEALARQKPVLMVFEDLHWIDLSSRELLDRTIERIARLPVLLVAREPKSKSTFPPRIRAAVERAAAGDGADPRPARSARRRRDSSGDRRRPNHVGGYGRGDRRARRRHPAFCRGTDAGVDRSGRSRRGGREDACGRAFAFGCRSGGIARTADGSGSTGSVRDPRRSPRSPR
jgi:hypothetical protein